MKTKITIGLILLTSFAFSAFAQTVKINPKKTVYTRKGKNIDKEKRTFTVTYPVATGASPAAQKNLTDSLSYWKTFQTTLAESTTETWLWELSYDVKYNNKGILDISLTQEGSGAYPDSSTIEKVIDLKTGKTASFTDVFKTDGLKTFAEMVNQKLNVEKKDLIKRIDKGEFGEENGKEANDALKEQIEGLEFTAETFNQYSVSDKGVTILYDAEFPHVIQAAQPDGRYFFTWAEVKPFIKPNGLLGQFIR